MNAYDIHQLTNHIFLPWELWLRNLLKIETYSCIPGILDIKETFVILSFNLFDYNVHTVHCLSKFPMHKSIQGHDL